MSVASGHADLANVGSVGHVAYGSLVDEVHEIPVVSYSTVVEIRTSSFILFILLESQLWMQNDVQQVSISFHKEEPKRSLISERTPIVIQVGDMC